MIKKTFKNILKTLVIIFTCTACAGSDPTGNLALNLLMKTVLVFDAFSNGASRVSRGILDEPHSVFVMNGVITQNEEIFYGSLETSSSGIDTIRIFKELDKCLAWQADFFKKQGNEQGEPEICDRNYGWNEKFPDRMVYYSTPEDKDIIRQQEFYAYAFVVSLAPGIIYQDSPQVESFSSFRNIILFTSIDAFDIWKRENPELAAKFSASSKYIRGYLKKQKIIREYNNADS